MNIKVTVVPVGPLQMNSVILSTPDSETPEAIIIDPGGDPHRLLSIIEQMGCTLIALLATHGHFDHVEGSATIQEIHDLPLHCHPDDVPLIENMNQFQAGYGLTLYDIPKIKADLKDGDTFPFAGTEIGITHVPGHSPGQLMFTLPGYAIVGDCLFAGSVGRTDLPGGDFATLEKSIRQCIYTLTDDTVVLCGHGPDTTVGTERTTNPVVAGV